MSAELGAILKRARQIWDEREKGFPRFVRQTWDQGTAFARAHTCQQAEEELRIERIHRARDRHAEGDETRSGSVERSEIEPGPKDAPNPSHPSQFSTPEGEKR